MTGAVKMFTIVAYTAATRVDECPTWVISGLEGPRVALPRSGPMPTQVKQAALDAEAACSVKVVAGAH